MTEKKSSILTSLSTNIGTRTHLVSTITEADMMRLGQVSGDFDPVHISSDFAKKTLLGAELSMECQSRDQYWRPSLNYRAGKICQSVSFKKG